MTQPILGDVYASFIDGKLGLGAPNRVGELAIVGVAGAGPLTIETIARDQLDTWLVTYGPGPLIERVIDAFQAGATIVRALRVSAAAAGVLGDVDDSEQNGGGIIDFTGTPNADYEIVIEILTGGERGTATFRWSPDGGDTWSDELASAATVVLTGTGLTVTFTDGGGPAASNDAGDIVRVNGAAPVATTLELQTALATLKAGPYRPETILIAGKTADAQWTAIATVIADLHATRAWYCHAIAEARGPAADETAAQWAAALLTEKTTQSPKFLSIVAARGELVDLRGRQRNTNLAGAYAGRIASTAKRSESPGYVARGPITGALALHPATQDSVGNWLTTLTDAAISDLSLAGYVTARRYEGLAGVYWTNGRTSGAPSSDFAAIERIRPLLTAATLARIALLPFLQGDADEAGQFAMQAAAQAPLNRMVAAGWSAELKAVIPPDQDIDGTGEVVVEIYGRHVPKATWIKLNLALSRELPE